MPVNSKVRWPLIPFLYTLTASLGRNPQPSCQFYATRLVSSISHMTTSMRPKGGPRLLVAEHVARRFTPRTRGKHVVTS
jgi:hypothetical protein